MANSEIKMSMSLNTAKATTALGKMKTGIAKFSSSALEKLGSVAKVASGALLAGFTMASKSALEYAKNLDMFAQVSNTTSEEFQYLAAGAREVGIESEKLADIYKDVSDKMGDYLENKAGPFVDFFTNIAPAIKVTAKEFENLSGPQILQKYYNSLEKANLSHDRITFYLEAIGNDAVRLGPKLKNLGAGFKEAGDRAKEMGLIMDDLTKDSLKKASTAIDEFKIKMTIAAGETLMGFQIMAKASKDVDFLSGAKGLGELIIGIATSNTAAVKSGAKDIEGFFVGMDQGAENAYKEMYGDTQNFEADFSDISNNIENKWIDTTKSITEENRIATKASIKEYEKWSATFDKISDEREKRAANDMTAQEQLNAVIKKRVALEEELATFRSGVDPFSAEAMQKQLELEKLLTDEQNLQVEAGNEAAEIEEAAIEAKTNKLDLELQLAKASGDPNRIAAAQKELDTETQIVALMNQHKISRDEASKILQDQNAHLETQKDLELELLNAQANGNDALARELQGRIDKEKEALAIMDEFGISIEKARVIAGKLAAINAGPDLNQSGFVTPKEQKAFDKIQKAKAKEEKKRQRAEIAAERNVSEEKRKRPGLLDAKKARDKELQEQRDIKKAGEQALKDWKKQGADAPKMFDLDGNPIGPGGKPIPGGGGGGVDPNAPGGGGVDPNAPGGGGKPVPDGPKQPGGGNDPSLEKLDKIITELGTINKSLQC